MVGEPQRWHWERRAGPGNRSHCPTRSLLCEPVDSPAHSPQTRTRHAWFEAGAAGLSCAHPRYEPVTNRAFLGEFEQRVLLTIFRAARDGRPDRHCQVTPAGIDALKASRKTLLQLWSGL